MVAQKRLVAAAALLALAASAQADVRLYGYLEADVGSYQGFAVDGDAGLKKTPRTTRVDSGNMMTSYIGFAGSEDLGNGVKAEFALESYIGNDTGATIGNIDGLRRSTPTNNLFGRTSWVGLSGGFGKVALGQYDNAFFTMGLTYNPFGSSMAFSPTMNSYYSFAGFAGPDIGVGLAYDTSWVNAITYESPTVSGFSGTLQYSPKEGASGGKDNKNNYAISGAYNQGPASAMLVYTASGADPGNPAYFLRQKNIGVGGSWDFGVVKAFGQFSRVKSYTGGDEISKQRFYQLGASVPVMTTGLVMAAYGETKITSPLTTDPGKVRQFSIGYDHTLSKRTSVFAAATRQKVTDAGTASSVAVGLKHNF